MAWVERPSVGPWTRLVKRKVARQDPRRALHGHALGSAPRFFFQKLAISIIAARSHFLYILGLKSFTEMVQGEFEFGEDPPGIRVFDIQIEELRADAAFPCS
jgi:hypothetical protein